MAAAASEPNTAINTINHMMGRFQRSAYRGDVALVLVTPRRGFTLADDVEPDPAVLGPARLIALHTDLGPQLAGDVHRSGVVKAQAQSGDVGPGSGAGAAAPDWAPT